MKSEIFHFHELFRAVQLSNVFSDGKTFPDCIPKRSLEEINADYLSKRDTLNFGLKNFVDSNFISPTNPTIHFHTDTHQSAENHIEKLWDVLTRTPDSEQGSLIALPNTYVVPGGRFREIYYWDSYFTMLGLLAQKRIDLARNMLANFCFLLDEVGHIPNGNRAYYISRSQPPFFCLMVKEFSKHDPSALHKYLPYIEKEYQFWMQGSSELMVSGAATRRVVKMANGTVLNRYWDDNPFPRPESYKEDVELQHLTNRDEEELYRNIRAAAESGWDFSTRWFADATSMETIRTTEIIPVDLNCLLYDMETTLIDFYKQIGENEKLIHVEKQAIARKALILELMWNNETNYFEDYDFVNAKTTTIKSLAGMFPFFFQVAPQSFADKSFEVIKHKFLQSGGLLTTLNNSGQQWDAPNGWAPLQWITYTALLNYGSLALADEVKSKWMSTNERVFKQTGKMMEKYNVADTTLSGGGGEYPNQDGFGWTNGVYIALKNSKPISYQRAANS